MSLAARTRWVSVSLMVFAGVVAAAHIGKLPPSLPAIRTELALDLVAGGWIFSIFGLIGGMFGILAGGMADFFGHRRLLILGLCLLAIGGVGGGLAGGQGQLLLSRVVEGLGFVAISVSAPSLISGYARGPDRRLAFGLWGTYMPAGSAAMILASPLVLDSHGWRGLWLAVAALTLVSMVIVAAGTRKDRASGNRKPPAASTSRNGKSEVAANIRLTIARRGPWLLSACFGLYTSIFITLILWLPTFLIEERAMTTMEAATLTAWVVAVNVPGNLAAGWLLHKGYPYWKLLAFAGFGMGLSALGMFSGELGDSLRYTLCLCLSGIGGLLPTTVLAAVPLVAPSANQVGTANGMLIQGSNLGQLVGPPAIGALVAMTGQWRDAVWLMIAAATGIVLIAWQIRRLQPEGRTE